MLIDWFTVAAQALNFVILVWLMKRFLYQPILHAIDVREKHVAAELATADKKQAEAEQQRAEYQTKNQQIDHDRAALMSKASEAAEAERQRLLAMARETAAALGAQRQKALLSEAHSLADAVRRRAALEVFAIAKKVLAELATTGLEERVTDVFIRRLRALDDGARARLAAAFEASSFQVLARSAFELPPEQRATLQNAVNEVFSADLQLRFEAAPQLVSGIELSASGQKLAWTIADHLESLERGVTELLDGASSGPPAGAEAERTRTPAAAASAANGASP